MGLVQFFAYRAPSILYSNGVNDNILKAAISTAGATISSQLSLCVEQRGEGQWE